MSQTNKTCILHIFDEQKLKHKQLLQEANREYYDNKLRNSNNTAKALWKTVNYKTQRQQKISEY